MPVGNARKGRVSIVEGACKECLPSQQAQQLPAGILVRRGTQDQEWGQQLKGGKRAFPSFELQTPGCTHSPLKNGDMEGFWESLKFPLIFPCKEPPKTAFLKCLCSLAPAIYLIWVHLQLPHIKCHTGISVEFRKISSRQRGKQGDWGFFLFPCFWQCSLDRLPAKYSTGLKKVLLAWSANLVPSMIHDVVRSPVCL